MAKVEDVEITVQSETASVIKLQFGGNGVDFQKETLRMYMDNSQHDPIETILRNIGVYLVLNGVTLEDVDNGAVLKNKLDKVKFKMIKS